MEIRTVPAHQVPYELARRCFGALTHFVSLPRVTIIYLRYVTGLQASGSVNGWRHKCATIALLLGDFGEDLFSNLFYRKEFCSNLDVGSLIRRPTSLKELVELA